MALPLNINDTKRVRATTLLVGFSRPIIPSGIYKDFYFDNTSNYRLTLTACLNSAPANEGDRTVFRTSSSDVIYDNAGNLQKPAYDDLVIFKSQSGGGHADGNNRNLNKIGIGILSKDGTLRGEVVLIVGATISSDGTNTQTDVIQLIRGVSYYPKPWIKPKLKTDGHLMIDTTSISSSNPVYLFLLGIMEKPNPEALLETSGDATFTWSADTFETQTNVSKYGKILSAPENVEVVVRLPQAVAPEVMAAFYENARLLSDNKGDNSSRNILLGTMEAGEPINGIPLFLITKEAMTRELVDVNVVSDYNASTSTLYWDGDTGAILTDEFKTFKARDSIVLLAASPNLNYSLTFGTGSQLEAEITFTALDALDVGYGWYYLMQDMLLLLPLIK